MTHGFKILKKPMSQFLAGILLLGLCFLPSAVKAITPAELATEAQKDYEAGRYAEAVKNWQTLVEIGFFNGEILSNIGNAYWREGKVGSAKLYFLKAQELQPRDPSIRANLAFAEEKMGEGASPDSLLNKLPLYRFSLNYNEALVLAAASCTLIFFFLIFGRIRSSRRWKLLSWVFVLPLLWSGTFLLKGTYQDLWAKPGIILNPQANLLEAPVLTSSPKEVLREGEVVQLLKSEGNFVLVKTTSGRKGWLPKDQMGEV